jgi:hypothetical protein
MPAWDSACTWDEGKAAGFLTWTGGFAVCAGGLRRSELSSRNAATARMPSGSSRSPRLTAAQQLLGNLAMFAAIRRASSRARYYAERVTGEINKTLFARAHSK